MNHLTAQQSVNSITTQSLYLKTPWTPRLKMPDCCVTAPNLCHDLYPVPVKVSSPALEAPPEARFQNRPTTTTLSPMTTH